MKRLKKMSYNKNFYVLVSLLFALILFFNASSIQLKNSGKNLTNMRTYSVTLQDVPIQVKYDSDKYFISGFDNLATVYLTSYNQVRLDAEKSKDTRTFTLVADLTNVTEGTMDVPIKIQELASGVNGQVDPNSVTITIEKKASKTFPVTAKVDEKLIPDGYKLVSTELDKSQVTVTSGADTLAKIDKVVAAVPSDTILSESYKDKVTLQAVDKDGKILAATIKPDTATLSVNIKKPSKQVPITGKITGTIEKPFTGFTFEIDEKNATISGDYEYLNSINQIPVSIDVSGITKEKTIEIPLTMDNVSITPTKVNVKVTPIKE
ncbi:CdaR family protein [Streptococcaceae bacterium ESL0687]|nr:CdaR family protein [Streptococcaceae bacterium ESL0687]